MSNYVRFPVVQTWRPLIRGPIVLAGLEPAGEPTDTPTPGGATAAGFAPTVQVAGAVGGATAAGQNVTATATLTAGGATAAGVGPSPALVAVPQGGADAGGQLTDPGAPTVVFENVVIPVAHVAPFEGLGSRLVGPLDTAPATETPFPGGAVAAGTSPTVQVAAAAGGAAAAGNAPAAAASVPQGGATAAGQTNAAQVPVTPGGATAGGQLTDPLSGGTQETPVPGGATAGGVGPVARAASVIGGGGAGGTEPTATAAVVISGATAAGVAITLILVPLTPGGADGGGQLVDPLQVFQTGFFDRPSPNGAGDSGTPTADTYDSHTPGKVIA